MKAVAYTHSLPISDPLALKDLVMVDPKLERPHDLLVKVAAVGRSHAVTHFVAPQKTRRPQAPCLHCVAVLLERHAQIQRTGLVGKVRRTPFDVVAHGQLKRFGLGHHVTQTATVDPRRLIRAIGSECATTTNESRGH